MLAHDCPFCDIVRDPGLAHIVLATPTLLVFLDRLPLTRGHLLCIPRLHYPHLPTFPAHISARIGEILPSLTAALTRVIGVEDFNVILNNGERAGQTVEHVHWHIIPRPGDGKWNMFARGPRTQELDDDEGAVLALEIKEEIGRGLWRSRSAGATLGSGARPIQSPPRNGQQAGLISHVHGSPARGEPTAAARQEMFGRMRIRL